MPKAAASGVVATKGEIKAAQPGSDRNGKQEKALVRQSPPVRLIDGKTEGDLEEQRGKCWKRHAIHGERLPLTLVFIMSQSGRKRSTTMLLLPPPNPRTLIKAHSK